MNRYIKIILYKKILNDLNSLLKLQSIMLSDDYMVGIYNGIELCIATIEEREPKYKNSQFRNDITENPNVKEGEVFVYE